MKNILERPHIREFLRFCLVGVICTVIDACVFYSIHSWTGYRVALVCGFSISIIANYFLNVFWSFHVKPTMKKTIGFLAAHCFNLFIVRMFLMWLFVEVFEIYESIAFIPTLLISIITNFLIVRFVLSK